MGIIQLFLVIIETALSSFIASLFMQELQGTIAEVTADGTVELINVNE